MDRAPLRDWSGRTAREDDLVTPRLVAEFRSTFAPYLFEAGDDVPPGFHWCLAPAIAPMAALGPDGHPERGGFLPPVPLPRRMWAGGEIETEAPLRTGDRVTRTSTIGDIVEKTGRSGPLVFVAVHHAYATERGLALRERHDIVYREAATPGETAPPAPEARRPRRDADLIWRVEASPVLLFRYSAITFNGHRIHYDAPYATGVEGYEGLVVHGPVQATLCLNLAAELGGGVPRRFRYRNRAPLIAGGHVTVKASRGPEGAIACWTERDDGTVCLEGEARAPGA